GGAAPARFGGRLPERVERGLNISGFLRMEGQPFVLALQTWGTPGYRLDRVPMNFSTLIARDRVCTGLGDNLMAETHRVSNKRVDKGKSVEFEQCIQQLADVHTEHHRSQLDFNLLSEQAERLCESLYFRRKPL